MFANEFNRLPGVIEERCIVELTRSNNMEVLIDPPYPSIDQFVSAMSSVMSIETNKRYIRPVHRHGGTSAPVPDPMNTLCARQR